MMTVINGRCLIPLREFEIKTGGEESSRAVAGRIHPVDPAAVARFKQVLADQEPTRKPRPQRRPHRPGLDADLQQKVEEHAARARARKLAEDAEQQASVEEPAPKEIEMTEKTELKDDMVCALHKRYMAGESMKLLAAELDMPWQTLQAEFRRCGMPKRPPIGQIEVAPTQVEPVKTAVSPLNGQADPVAVADGMDRIISLGRLVRELKTAGVAVKVSGRVMVELEF
jgi:hypothetical protein